MNFLVNTVHDVMVTNNNAAPISQVRDVEKMGTFGSVNKRSDTECATSRFDGTVSNDFPESTFHDNLGITFAAMRFSEQLSLFHQLIGELRWIDTFISPACHTVGDPDRAVRVGNEEAVLAAVKLDETCPFAPAHLLTTGGFVVIGSEQLRINWLCFARSPRLKYKFIEVLELCFRRAIRRLPPVEVEEVVRLRRRSSSCGRCLFVRLVAHARSQ
mmetsp:Transcript_51744/g.159465  ORF Transcript_51744/g.159465 Transcript_51744/m.159465 type:complete len:215 (+) Transcript_51744:520-1164(+)